MSGRANYAVSPLIGGGQRAGVASGRVSKLSGVGAHSKKKRGRRPMLQSLKRRVFNCVALSSLLFVLAFLIYNTSVPSSGEDRIQPFLVRQSMVGLNGTYAGGVAEAHTDITTKGLYDEIAFKDVEGGVWRQGWNVQYKGSEWDREPLKVIVVPHSHNDPGWIRTVEEYYQERTRSILNTIIKSLKKEKRRKFIWEEMSYLERWWQDASATEKEDLKSLVTSGQLEIVGGGWVMNDEANSHYFAIIQQMIAGNLWLANTLGVTVKNAWAIDPFGHSPTMAYLLRRMGFKNMLIQRTHYEVKKALAKSKNLEFMWRQGWDASNTTDIFCHMMPFYSYDIPHTCGPEPAVCCQFDYWRLPGVHGAERCPWHQDPMEIIPENVQERSEMLLDQYRKKSTLYRSNTLLIPLGDDFRYITMQEAELQFTNLQKIFDYINSQPHLKASVRFGTLNDYFETLRAEAGKPTSKVATADSVPGFPTLSGDFFTYSDRAQDYWSGYYVTRPFYKAVDRVLEETMRAADILFTLTSAHCQATANSEFPLTETSKLIAARRNLALFQHHDGVTGTAKNHVVVDYGEKMHHSLVDLLRFMADSVYTLLSKQTSAGKCPNHNAEEIQFYMPEQARANHAMLPVRTAVEVTGDQVKRVVLFNSLEESLKQVVTVVVDDSLMCVFDSEWKSVPSQVSPEWDFGSTERLTTGRHRLQWEAKVPPLGLQTYIVAPSATAESCIKASPAQIRILNSPSESVCPSPYKCSSGGSEPVEISNQHQKLTFDLQKGLLKGVKMHDGWATVVVEEELAFYTSHGSGAYLFAPSGTARSFVEPGGLIFVTKGPLMEEVYTIPKCELGNVPVVRSARLFAINSVQGAVAEMEYYTQLLSGSFNNKELIARFKTELNNKGVFYSDLNGFQTIRRETLDKIPIQANYYPMPALAFIQCPGGRRFSIHSRQALGVASLGKGYLEVMLDRRLMQDDGRGLGQGILDNHPNSVVFHLLLEKNSSKVPNFELSSSSRVASLLSHRAGAQLNHPLHAFLGQQEPMADIEEKSMGKNPLHKLRFSPLVSGLPCDLHMVSLQALSTAGVTDSKKESVGLILQRRGFDPSYGVNWDPAGHEQCSTLGDIGWPLHAIFKDFSISNARLTSLNLVHDGGMEFGGVLEQGHRKEIGIGTAEKTSAMIEFRPMEIQAYKFQLRPLD